LVVIWRRTHRPELLLYFVAFVIPAIGTLVNNGMNLGVLPQNALTLNLYQISTLIHVLVMSIGLALRQRQILHDKATAEQSAITAAQRAEEQRRLVAMLSHEFHNPLASIDRSAQMIQIKTPELATEESERLEQIRGSAATLSGLVDNFLLTEAVDHGSLALARESCLIQLLLEDVVQTLGESSAERIHLSVAPTDTRYYLDPTMVGMAILNLADNALKYSPSGTPVEISVTADDAGVRMCVADRGPGLSPEELENIGTPYYRAGSSLGKKGTGLGYYFAKRIIEAHEGQMKACSRDGGGLIVEILLPKAPPAF
jgi:signal transduction histidine kinase